MTVYQYNLYTKETFNASGKAKKDVSAILDNMGIKNFYTPSKHRVVRVVQQFIMITKLKVSKNNTLIIQYPGVINTFIKKVSGKCRLVALVHDLRAISAGEKLEEEISILNRFDVVISHNPSMTKYLKTNGCKAKIIDLNIFDYLVSSDKCKPSIFERRMVAFAGNLNKSNFIKQLSDSKDVSFNLYGKIDRPQELQNVKYSGMVPSDEIVSEIEGDYGLVWDGNSTHSCAGKLGEYLRYNNPHKLSLYLSAGKPVIVWKEAAIAPFVRKNNIGIIVDNLDNLSDVLGHVSEKDYRNMICNVKEIRNKLIKGQYTKDAITKSLKYVSEIN